MQRRQFMQAAMAALLLAPFPALAARKPVVTVVLKSLRNEFFTLMIKGAQQHYASHSADYQLNIEGVQEESDINGQEAIIQRSLARKDDALIIAPADSSVLIPLLLKAISQNTLVINLDNKLDDRVLAKADVNIPFVGPSNFSGARLVGDYVLSHLTPGSKVAIIEGIAGSINAKSRSDGFRKSISAAGMTLAGMRWGDWVSDRAQQAALDLMAATPDLAALLCGNDNMALGAVAAVAQRHRTGKILVSGYDNIPAVQPLLADRRLIATVDQHPAWQVQSAIAMALDGLAKHRTQSQLPSIVSTPVTLIKKG